MNTIIAILCIIINSSFTKDTNYRIALFIIEHLYEVPSISMNEIAERCFTSVSTVKKFLKTIGHNSYSTFKFQVENSISVRTKQMQQRHQNMNSDYALRMIQTIYPDLDKDTLLNTIHAINREIQQCDRVVILGASYPNALAVNYQEDMIVMKKTVIIEPVIPRILNDFQNIRENDFIILTTISGSFFDIYPMRKHELQKFKHLAIITQENTDLNSFASAIPVRLPVSKDNEKYNYFLMSIYTLLKEDYYQMSIQN